MGSRLNSVNNEKKPLTLHGCQLHLDNQLPLRELGRNSLDGVSFQFQYRRLSELATGAGPPSLQNKQRSFLVYGFGVGAGTGPQRRDSHVTVNVAPTSHDMNDTPEIRKYKKRFSSEILCASLWGTFLIIVFG